MNQGDLAESVAEELATGSISPSQPEIEMTVDEDDPLDAERGYVFANKIRFANKTDDEEILSKIRLAADGVFQELFSEAIAVIDKFYLAMRVPRTTQSGQLMTDAHGRTVWETDEDTGRPVERLDQLTGQDMDQAILTLERILLEIAPRVNEMRLDALFAQNTAKDAFDDGWPASGTLQDRTSKANTASRLDRWHGFFKYYLYSTANVFANEVRSFGKKLENIRYRQVNAQ